MSFGFGFSLPTLGWHLSGGGASSGYSVTKSLRFRSSASAYLNRTASASISTYTISMWVKRGTLTSNYQYLFSHPNSGNTDGYGLAFNITTDTLYYYNGTAQATTAAYRDPAAWYHIVFSNNAGSFTIYVNGVSVKTGTATAIPSGAVMNLGRYGYTPGFYFDGEQAEINFVDGQALAPTAFGAFSTYNQWLPKAYTGTYGTNGFYLPFSGGTATSYAGSFNGSTQYITAPSNAAFDLGSSDFTIECWIYSTVAGSIQYFAGRSSVAGLSNSIIFYKEAANTLSLYVKTATAVNITATSVATIPLNTWTHVAGVRNGATLNLYINGVQDGTAALSTSAVATTTEVFAVGATGSFATGRWNGSVSNFRLVNGTAVYTANFVPPTAPLTAITNTSLLTLQNATIVDNSTNAFTITNNGTVVTSVQSPFLNTTVLAADSSGNANNWTPNNISLTAGSTYDSLTDVPTLTSATVANYAVLNPLDSGMVLSSANLTTTTGSSASTTVRATIGVTSGKWYWEVQATSNEVLIGVANSSASLTQYLGGNANGWSYQNTGGSKYNNGVGSAYGATWTTNDVIGIALDMTAGTIVFYKNNTSQGTAFTGLTGTLFPAVSAGVASTSMTVNFGQQPFTYTPPTGFLALNTYNI